MSRWTNKRIRDYAEMAECYEKRSCHEDLSEITIESSLSLQQISKEEINTSVEVNELVNFVYHKSFSVYLKEQIYIYFRFID